MNQQIVNHCDFKTEQDRENHHTQYQTKHATGVGPQPGLHVSAGGRTRDRNAQKLALVKAARGSTTNGWGRGRQFNNEHGED